MANLRVVELSITGLFELYDHSVTLKQRDRVTIIHGPNGVGKTVLLNCLSALFGGRFHVLRETPFSKFSVMLSDKSEIIIRREVRAPGADRGSDPVEMSVEVKTAGGRPQSFELKISADVVEMARRIERETPGLLPISESRYFDQRRGIEISAEEVVERYLSSSRLSRLGKLREAEPEPLRKLRERVKVRFIETNRLVRIASDIRYQDRSETPTLSNTVNHYAQQIHTQVEAALAQYGRKSQQLDQSFPQRLIQEELTPLPLAQLKGRLESLETKHQQLSEIGLLDKIPNRPFDTRSLDTADPYKLIPMTLYLRDNEEKIAVFDEIAGRAKLLLESANRKFRNKRLVINKDRGLVAVGRSRKVLPLDSLSSGEQHEIVLLYELLFNISPDTLVLIDEPELSLHVTWQKMFLPEILSVSSQVGFDVIIATHSPFVVGGRRDLLVALDADPDDDAEIDEAV